MGADQPTGVLSCARSVVIFVCASGGAAYSLQRLGHDIGTVVRHAQQIFKLFVISKFLSAVIRIFVFI